MFCFYVYHAPLQANYFLTEAELLKLEKISQELKERNNQLRTQQASLKATVVTLKVALKAKEDSLKNLEDSFNAYESEVMVHQKRQLEKIESLTYALKRARFWRRVWCSIALVLVFVLIILVAIKAFKKKFLL